MRTWITKRRWIGRALVPVLRGRFAGANGIYDSDPIQRLFPNHHALSAHIGFSRDAQGSPWGLVSLGGDFSSPTL